MIYTTLNVIKAHNPCANGWRTLFKSLNKTQADNEPLPLLHVLDSNGLNDALWCLRIFPQYDSTWRLYAVWCARRVQHLMTDPRSIEAIDVAERFAKGEATEKELRAAYVAADDAAYAARAAACAAAAYAARAAAAYAARAAACAAARAVADDAAYDAEREAQTVEFKRLIMESN